ncbi:DUF4840 domain-containing protein [Parabacteroides faecis]|uniref:DUF4840 domain-containing protein n=1 Tax=Parabacteroides TaxID=375288 RepID=UPI000EFE7051|nr:MULTISPECIES: DUF4840 domain-containing protein [Parabacteroides]MBC8619792.1 DUF4840 domain-containing protein [Parabacteroides faecis]RHS00601.1 DUF4840 domain-containing protein [Parabacteroides sp. AF14-59]
MKKTLKWSLVMMLAVVGLTFASCSDDDDNTPTVGTVEDVNGEFTGKMTYTKEAKATEADPTATELELKVANDSIQFEKFPYQALVVAILGEEASKPIIAQIGDSLQYKTIYTATMNAAKDSVVMTLNPDPLKISIEALNMEVEVNIEAPNKASYAVSDKNLKFALKAASVKVGETDFPFTPMDLSFDMKKK